MPPAYMLDTRMCIYLMKNQPEAVARRFAQCHVGDVVISAITYAELEHGVAASPNPARARENLAALIEDIPVAPFDAAAGLAYGSIGQAALDRRQDCLDRLIAAHAAALKAPLVTHNVKDFTHYPGLALENWLLPTP